MVFVKAMLTTSLALILNVLFVSNVGCCIYHKQRGFGESDSESDTSDKELDHCHGNAYEPSDK